MVKLPYFDYLLALLDAGDDKIEASFGRHVHWGYWEQPQHAELTAADFALATENLSAHVCQAGEIQNGSNILDVGCGFGGTIAHINDNYTGMKLVGVNLDERQLVRAREIVKPSQANQIQFLQGNACALPFPGQSFDVVLAVECIFHFPDRQLFFKEAYRVLKPGGYLALSDFVSSAVILPFTHIPLPARFTAGFYGKCNLQYTTKHYRTLAKETQFKLREERNITVNTLPTYRYLRKLTHLRSTAPAMAIIGTATIEVLSLFRLVNYYIYAFKKD